MTKDDKQAPEPSTVYKRRVRAGKRTVARATRNMTDLMVGVSSAMADGARAFGDAVKRDDDELAAPTDVVEAGALAVSRAFEGLAATWRTFYENLQRDHADDEPAAAAPAPAIDYEKLADLVAERLKQKM